MSEFHFHYPISVRYADLDPQWHVNNARFLSYMEQARLTYVQNLGLFDGKTFVDLPLIVADIHISYLAPIEPGETVDVALRVSKIGNKSLVFEYELRNAGGDQLFARAETVMVVYDYHLKQSVPVPEEWHKRMSEFEKKEL